MVNEDIDFLRKATSTLSERYDVAVAKSMEQATSFLHKHEVDLIVMDYRIYTDLADMERSQHE